MSGNKKEIPGVVLAGGRSSRFGSDKRVATYKGATLGAHASRILSDVVDTVYFSVATGLTLTAARKVFPDLGHELVEKELIRDEYEDAGPLGALHASIVLLDSDWVLVLAVDLPDVDPSSLSNMLDACREDHFAVIATTENESDQPLAGCYSRKILPYIEDALQQRRNGVQRLLKAITRECGKNAVARIVVPEEQLRNVNNPDDLLSKTDYSTPK